MASIWLPLNSVTEKFWYINSNGMNQRVCVSAKVDRPLTYKVSKISDAKPIGLIKITLDQDNFNEFSDYIERDENGYIIGMWADYYDNNIGAQEEPSDGLYDVPLCTLSASNQTIRVGGSYKTITATLTKDSADVTDQYKFKTNDWKILIGDEDITDNIELLTIKESDKNNAIKIKFANDRSYINKIITVQCIVDKSVGEIQLTPIG